MAELLYWITLDCTGVLNEVASWCVQFLNPHTHTVVFPSLQRHYNDLHYFLETYPNCNHYLPNPFPKA